MMGGLSASSSATSSADTSLSNPFVNNGELTLGSDGNDFSGSGVGESNPSLDNPQTTTSSAGHGTSAALPGGGALSSLDSAVGASGQSAIVWVSVAGIVVACLLALHSAK